MRENNLSNPVVAHQPQCAVKSFHNIDKYVYDWIFALCGYERSCEYNSSEENVYSVKLFTLLYR